MKRQGQSFGRRTFLKGFAAAANDLYVRARIESPTERGLATAPLHPKMRCIGYE